MDSLCLARILQVKVYSHVKSNQDHLYNPHRVLKAGSVQHFIYHCIQLISIKALAGVTVCTQTCRIGVWQ